MRISLECLHILLRGEWQIEDSILNFGDMPIYKTETHHGRGEQTCSCQGVKGEEVGWRRIRRVG